jgi:type IV secretory pathway TraG/TraD family ATPase VirD4
VFFAANDLETARYVSESCGEITVDSVSTSQRKSFKYEAPSKTISKRVRPLIKKDELRQLSVKKEIIIAESSYPVLANKIRYYKEKAFKDRLLPPPAVPALRPKEESIPDFDIPETHITGKPEIDPNQPSLPLDDTSVLKDENLDGALNVQNFQKQPKAKRSSGHD